jgi:PadR family transcriptional regulator, regulatory protein PadR
MCLLATIARRLCYGYELVQQLAQQGLDLVSEGSIYPLLSRLQRHGYIEGYLVASRDGPKRKYYRLLLAGGKL